MVRRHWIGSHYIHKTKIIHVYTIVENKTEEGSLAWGSVPRLGLQVIATYGGKTTWSEASRSTITYT